METELKQSSKKRLMYITGEDFYYLTYNSLLLLHEFGCFSKENRFHDHRKLAYLVEFAADYRLTSILQRTGSGKILNPFDRQLLVNAHSKGAGRTALFTRLSYALEMKNIISVNRNVRTKCLDFWLTEQMRGHPLFTGGHFKTERENSEILRIIYNRVRSAGLETMLNNLFQKHGVSTWLD